MKKLCSAILVAIMGLGCAHALAAEPPAKVKSVINPPPTAKDWADLAKLPDWSGV